MTSRPPMASLSRLLVTGGAGFIGSNFVRMALANGFHLLNVDNLTYAAGAEMLQDVAVASEYQFLQADIVDTQSLSEAFDRFQPTAVVHFAAETHVDRSIADANPFVRSNILGTSSLLQVALKYWRGVDNATKSNFRFLHISTDEVFGSLGEQGSFNEQSAYDPRSPYAASKAAADHLVRSFLHTYQLPVILVHPSNNYGPNQHPEKLIPMVIRCCLLGQPIPIYGTGANVRDWMYVEDHCRAILQILSAGRVGESYNVSSGNEWQNLSLVQTLCDLIDELQPRTSSDRPRSRSLIRLVADRPGHDFRYSLDCSKIKRELGWTAVHSGLEGFRETIKWYLQNTNRLGIEN